MTSRQTFRIARYWDAGEAGCSSLVLGLKQHVERIEPGELLQVTALDAAAAIDVAVWCHMTGHALAAEDHPTYVIKRNGNGD